LNRFEQRLLFAAARTGLCYSVARNRAIAGLICLQAIVITGESAAGRVFASMITVLRNSVVNIYTTLVFISSSNANTAYIRRIIIAVSDVPQGEPMPPPHA
jgi:hypothetical protein